MRLPVVPSSFGVASTKREAALARSQGWQPWQERGWALAPRDRGPKAGMYCWMAHLVDREVIRRLVAAGLLLADLHQHVVQERRGAEAEQVGRQPVDPERLVDAHERLHRLLRVPHPAGGLHADAAAGLLEDVPDRLEHDQRHRHRRRGRELPGRGLDEVGARGDREQRGSADVVVRTELTRLEDHLQVLVSDGLLDLDDLVVDLRVAAGEEGAAVDHHVDLVGPELDDAARLGDLEVGRALAGRERGRDGGDFDAAACDALDRAAGEVGRPRFDRDLVDRAYAGKPGLERELEAARKSRRLRHGVSVALVRRANESPWRRSASRAGPSCKSGFLPIPGIPSCVDSARISPTGGAMTSPRTCEQACSDSSATRRPWSFICSGTSGSTHSAKTSRSTRSGTGSRSRSTTASRHACSTGPTRRTSRCTSPRRGSSYSTATALSGWSTTCARRRRRRRSSATCSEPRG